MPYKVDVNLKSMYETLVCDHSNEISVTEQVLLCSTVYYAT